MRVDVDMTLPRDCGAYGEADCSVPVELDLVRGEADVGAPVWADALDDPATSKLAPEEEERARCTAWEKWALDRLAYSEEAA